MTADQIIAHLDLQPHPEGGWYRQTHIDDAQPRAHGTCFYFLFKAGESNHCHKLDTTEIWHYYAGAPLILSLSETDEGPARDHLLTPDLTKGVPQLIVPVDHWQKARSTGDFTLVGCTFSPGFRFEGFELAAPVFEIPTA